MSYDAVTLDARTFAVSICEACKCELRLEEHADARVSCGCGASAIQHDDGLVRRLGLAGPVRWQIVERDA